MATRIQHRRGTAAEWTAANPVLSDGEIGYIRDSRSFKVGDGVTVWNSLPLLFSDTYATPASVTAASTTDRARANHTGEQAISTVTGLQTALDSKATTASVTSVQTATDAKVDKTASVGYQTWNGTAWTARPTGYGHVEAFSDGTRGSTKDVNASAPTGAVDGDRWWKALA